jgi:hypothetical protein
MNKTLIAKVLLVLIFGVMAAVVIQGLFFNPNPLYAAGWGDAFVNDQGKILCICLPDQDDCYPCAPLIY